MLAVGSIGRVGCGTIVTIAGVVGALRRVFFETFVLLADVGEKVLAKFFGALDFFRVWTAKRRSAGLYEMVGSHVRYV